MTSLKERLHNKVEVLSHQESIDTDAKESLPKKRVTNRSITCSVELRNRLRVMAATKGVPMQELLESWMKEKLTEAGF